METSKPRGLLDIEYFEAEQAYLKRLPLEHFMESTDQATQREITLASLLQVAALTPMVQVFNELLVQYRIRGAGPIRQVVPDNMVVMHSEKIQAQGSFNLPLQPVGPFWVLEYVSKSNKRKDYEENFDKYEREVKVPYYLTFYPDDQELSLYHRRRSRYVSVKPNEHGRLAIPEMETEVALLDGWARFWFRGELLPVVGELRKERDRLARRAENAEQVATIAQQRAENAEQELARLRAELGRLQQP
jgi:hypothetical protein